MDKQFDPKKIESHWESIWHTMKIGQPGKQNQPFTMMFPPPNVTGNLHMGHGFLITISDILMRYQRMQQKDVLWQMGTDHAGISTQMVVTRECERKGLDVKNLQRDEFLHEVDQWIQNVKIHDQIKKMGASVDWDSAIFTMDDHHSKAVTTAFVKLYRDKLIYRGKKLVNWDTQFKTAVSDLEVENKEEKGHLYHIAYPYEDGSGQLVVATTRPETLFGDVAVALNPNDTRLKQIPNNVILPLTGRTIPVIEDEYVDLEFGTGCLKITPGHDFNDHEVGLRHQLVPINILDESGILNTNVPSKYQGMTTQAARKAVIDDLQEAGLLIEIKDHTLMVPYSDKSNTIIEPRLTDQWFVSMEPLADEALSAVKEKKVNLIPGNWEKTYNHFLNNIQDWCISRQIWWGHRIPAWYDNDGNIYVGMSEGDVRKQYQLDKTIQLTQDEDVLDTWFSSSLYPFATLGWPDDTKRLEKHFPNDLLITGYDILFFWVARMIMMSLKLTGQVPFKNVYLHGLVRDENGHKMSKSKGNVIDPLDLINGIDCESLTQKRTQGMMQPKLKNKISQQTKKHFPQGIEEHGTDALRMCFAAMAVPGRDIRFHLDQLRGYKFFCNKIWNAVRLIESWDGQIDHQLVQSEAFNNPIDLWIHAQFNSFLEQIDQHLHEYRFDLIAKGIYEFTWHTFCDWYLEFVKVAIQNDPHSKSYTVAYIILEKLLRAIHPVMPFISETLWQQISPKLELKAKTIAVLEYPKTTQTADPAEYASIVFAKRFIARVRNLRSECNISPAQEITIELSPENSMMQQQLKDSELFIKRLCKAIDISWVATPDPISARTTLEEINIDIPLKGLIDPVIENERIAKSILKLEKSINNLKQKLDNPKFRQNAPKALLEENEALLSEQNSALKRLNDQAKTIQKLL